MRIEDWIVYTTVDGVLTLECPQRGEEHCTFSHIHPYMGATLGELSEVADAHEQDKHAPPLPNGRCGQRGDHEPHDHVSTTLGAFRCRG